MNIEAYTFFFQNCALNSTLFILVGFAISLFGGFLFLKSQTNRWSYLILFVGVALVGSGFALIPEYLNSWDEQFHALVAKNMTQHPFKPYLFGDQFVYDFKNWSKNHIWLHKQPLFLWQIAASFKVFGVNLFALRLPSILLHAATSVLVLSMAKRFLTSFLALSAAILVAFSSFQLNLISGVQGMDHNDVSFLFYCTASFWSWIKYNETKDFKYVLLIGLFSGGAILCKWLVGLIVYAGWGMVIVLTQRKEKQEWKNLMKAVVISILIVIPWQMYCYFTFPTEYVYEINYNSLHFSQAIEGHAGDSMYHFEAMKNIYGGTGFLSILIWVGMAIMLFKGFVKRNRNHLFASVVFCVVYVFFTLAKTKLEAYTLVVSAVGFIALFMLFQEIIDFVQTKKGEFKIPTVVLSLFLVVVCLFHFQIEKVNNSYFAENDEVYLQARKKKTAFVLSTIQKNPTNQYYVKDVRNMSIAVNASFYTTTEIYPYFEGCENWGVVIDVDGVGEEGFRN